MLPNYYYTFLSAYFTFISFKTIQERYILNHLFIQYNYKHVLKSDSISWAYKDKKTANGNCNGEITVYF